MTIGQAHRYGKPPHAADADASLRINLARFKNRTIHVVEFSGAEGVTAEKDHIEVKVAVLQPIHLLAERKLYPERDRAQPEEVAQYREIGAETDALGLPRDGKRPSLQGHEDRNKTLSPSKR